MRRPDGRSLLALTTAIAALAITPPPLAAQQPPPTPAAAQRTATTSTLTVSVSLPDGAPVAGARVRLLGMARSVVAEASTDAEGRARLTGLLRGSYQLHVTHPQLADAFRLVQLHAAALQVQLTMSPTALEERVTVTASRGGMMRASEVPATVQLLRQQELRTRAVDLLPRMLDEQPGVLTQQTTPGQGSPILRGQSAQAVLYLIDGIRYNNATYRSGNTQYLAWVPDVGVDGVETLLGPAAVNYGSDALGGAINVLTRPAPAFTRGPIRTNGSLRLFGASASLGAGVNATFGLAAPRLAGYVATSAARHQDLRGGRGRDSHHAARRFLGLDDRTIRRLFGGRYEDTAYSQWGLSAKAAYRLAETATLTGYLAASRQYDVRRYDRLLGGDGRVRADFEPQRLLFGYLRYERVFRDTFFDATVSINDQLDGRIDQRRPTSAVRRERNGVTAFGFESAVSRTLGNHLPTLGVELYHERVDASRSETLAGVTQPVRARFPDGSRYTSFGLFALDDLHAAGGRLQLSVGGRYSAFRYRARASDNVIGGVPVVPDAEATFDDVTFNAGASWALLRHAHVWGRVARGFRAPSVFDLGELGLTGGGFEVSPEDAVRVGAMVGESAGGDALSTGVRWQPLRPEVLWSFEAGFRWFSDRLRFELTAFDSEFYDAISRRVVIADRDLVGTMIGGQPILAQDPAGRLFVPVDPDPVVSRANIGRMRVWGLELLAQKPLGAAWLATLKASLQRGRELDTGLYARKIAPDNATLLLRWRSPTGDLWLEGVVRAARRQGRLNPAELEDRRVGAFRDAGDIADFFLNQGPRLGLVSDGVLTATGETLEQVIVRLLGPEREGAPLFTATPGWVSVGIRGGWRLSERQQLTFALRNLTDANYRMHGSGFDAPGIGLDLSYSASF